MKIFENDDIIINEVDTIDFSFKKNTFQKSFTEFLKKYPELSTSTVRIGTDAITAYKTAKNSTVRFFARSTYEKKLYKDIVEILKKSGSFKLVSKRYKDGGDFYEMVRD